MNDLGRWLAWQQHAGMGLHAQETCFTDFVQNTVSVARWCVYIGQSLSSSTSLRERDIVVLCLSALLS